MYSKYLHEDLVLFGQPFDPTIKCVNEVRVESGVISIVEKYASKNKLTNLLHSFIPN